MALPEPGTLWAVHAEGRALALSVKRTRMAAGAGRILKQPEPYEQIRQREPLLAERNRCLHQVVLVRWERSGAWAGLGGGRINVGCGWRMGGAKYNPLSPC